MFTALRSLTLLVALSTAAAWAGAAEEGLWWAYRDAYRVLVRFDKQSRPKQLIQQQLQVQPLAAGVSLEGLSLRLAGPHTALELPLDGALQARVPLSKAAYDDNAALRLNRPAGAFALRVRLAIAPRADGLYPVTELRQACDQALDYQALVEPERVAGKHCVGVSFAFPRSASPAVSLQTAGPPVAMTAAPGPLYPDDVERGYAVVVLRWSALGAASQLHSAGVPLVIAPLFE